MTRRRLLYNRSLCSRLLLLILIVATICAAGAGVGMSADITVTSFNTTLSNNTPANGTSILAPTISINATNTVSGINASSAKMTVEGVQVTLTSTGSGPIFKFINTSTSTYAHGDTVNVAFNVSNNAGDMTNTSWMFYIDNVNPTISITSPGDGYPTTASSINISGIANGTGSPSNVTVNGTAIPFTAGFNITFEANVSLSLGTNIIYANITDAAGNINSTNITIIRNPESGAGSDIITVGGGGSGAAYASIQAAVDNATAGDTILVYNGTYIENVVVKKRLTIRSVSENTADTIVQAASSNDHVFNVSADYVNISGFTVRGASDAEKAGIHVDTAGNCNISSNNVSDNYYGIRLYYSDKNTLINNNISNNGNNNIELYLSNNNTIISNNVSSNLKSGIKLFYSNNNTMNGNNASNNIVGIEIMSSSDNMLNNNYVNLNSADGIRLDDSSNNALNGNNVSNNFGYGFRLFSSSNNNTLTNNTANNNNIVGIRLKDSITNALYMNYLSDNTNSDASDNTGSNQWDSGTKGNYYSDYTGSDSNGDGIGDTPYTIPGGGSMDNYPLISLTTLSDKTPASGTSVLIPTISINATNTVFGINASSAKMTVGGVQVTLTPTSSGDTFAFTNASATTYVHGDTVNVTFNVSDNAGNTASTSWMFYIDNINPTINITSPVDGYSTTADWVKVSGTVNGTGSPPHVTGNALEIGWAHHRVTFNGTFEANIPLSIGANIIYANVTDAAGNTNSTLITITRIPTSGGNRGHSDSGETLRIISTASDDDTGEETPSEEEMGDIVNAPKDRGATDGDNADENDFDNNDGRDENTFKTRPFEAKLPLYAGFGIISLLLTFVGVLRSRGWKL